MPEYFQGFKTYLKTISQYLNPNRTVSDKDIDDIFELDRQLSKVCNIVQYNMKINRAFENCENLRFD